jgi:hypothetical protein
MQFEDENTRFFHAMATERHRKNVISQILDESGRMISDHGEKSALLFQEFKRRLGTSVRISMQFDLHAIIPPHNNLDQLRIPFNREEIDSVVCGLPVDRARGPDGSTPRVLSKLGPSSHMTCTSFVRNFSS